MLSLILINSLIPRRRCSSSSFTTGAFCEEATWIELSQHGWSFTPLPAITFPSGKRKWAVVGKDNWILFRTYLLSDFRTSPPHKRSQPSQTGPLRCKGEIFRMPETASLDVRGLNNIFEERLGKYKFSN
ncbi:hypothetical protein AVEN_218010-1 [Araneus ventricosus]|uniref:Uncharacterized protein n=1 Tax=Araneus ventricosus TaxID=182803 RepID=A0A4Y2JCM2_ARAVE|nr:hypothetical protein AVEN_71245-1 [Araneus ventricosus]GBM87675.1 hypothetical protein AVEN_132260-1 [Araneus ventricosus]GBM87681.1 hypothetical protein AVEN_167993-1 [Araneus ventricosus]GBM87700.1 hypothetical protein AVEN_218010-1 [Araneus ventricosus]